VHQRCAGIPERVGLKEQKMPAKEINRASGIVLIVLSLTALLDVLVVGYTQPTLADEGTGAHVFQIAIVAMVATGLIFLATADWAQPMRTMRRLAFPAAVVVLAFAALYYLEHYR
jgi:putative Ca2+/H+ antiporter (TMEM165/GDT1 family)